MTSFKKLFLIIYIPLALVLLCAFYFNYKIMVSDADKYFFATMKEKWALIENIILTDTASLETYALIKKAGDLGAVRITIISPDGTVLNDSALPYSEVKTMQNHKTRDEIRNAFYDSPFYAVRQSPTTGLMTVYYAEKAKEGHILRIAARAEYLEQIKNDAMKNSLIIFTAVLALSALIAANLARKISKPIRQLKEFTDAVNTGNTEYHLPHFGDKSIDEVSEVIYKMHSSLAKEKRLADIEREKLNTIFISMDEGIILMNKNNEIVHFNTQAADYLGLKLHKGLNVISDIDDVETIMFFKQVMEQEEAERKRIKFKDSIFEFYGRRIENQILAVFGEITDKVQYEAFKTELIGNITHEIKTPLALVMGASETILKDNTMPEGTRTRFIETIYRNSGKLNTLINDMLELHKLECSSDFRFVENLTDIKTVLSDLTILLNSGIEKEIIYDTCDTQIGIRPDHLESVLANLINNAIKYSHGTKIIVNIKHEENKVKIIVADEGPVIPENQRKRIFERFYTISKSRTRSYSGSGLGLSIVKHIAGLYGGKVKVYENDFGGNTFEVILKEKEVLNAVY